VASQQASQDRYPGFSSEQQRGGECFRAGLESSELFCVAYGLVVGFGVRLCAFEASQWGLWADWWSSGQACGV